MKALVSLLACKRVLLLQGPLGNFFWRFGKWLEKHDKQVIKINFNGGDEFFYPASKNVVGYRAHIDQFESWLLKKCLENKIDAMVCFGDCRAYHRIAKAVALQNKIQFFAFEEGYLRPDFITFEKEGVNANSNFMAKADFSPSEFSKSFSQSQYKHKAVGKTFGKMACYAVAYYLACAFRESKYPYYLHHRPLNVFKEGSTWIRAYWRKKLYAIREKNILEQAKTNWTGQYFLVALQVHNDSQVMRHSGYHSVSQFIEQIVLSFAHAAAKTHKLIIKHHPMDRGYHDYTNLIKRLSKQYQLGDRLIYVHDLHLPTLLNHSLGLITINSTVGLQSVFHKKPTLVMGKALYDKKGLTHQGSLSSFWRKPQNPNPTVYRAFRERLLETTQLNGSFYGINPWQNHVREVVQDYHLRIKHMLHFYH